MNELSILDSLFGTDGWFDAVAPKTFVPSVDVKETKDSYVLEMDLPGKTEKDVEISLKDSILTIASAKVETKTDDKKAEKSEKAEAAVEEKWLLRERSASSFKRSFELPKDADVENVSASFKNGVLSVVIARKAVAAERRITIQCA